MPSELSIVRPIVPLTGPTTQRFVSSGVRYDPLQWCIESNLLLPSPRETLLNIPNRLLRPRARSSSGAVVRQDISGVDLNCGCPKPFSTHSGMGAALLTNPDLLCAILTALRMDLPPEISVSAKIRLLPTQADT